MIGLALKRFSLPCFSLPSSIGKLVYKKVECNRPKHVSSFKDSADRKCEMLLKALINFIDPALQLAIAAISVCQIVAKWNKEIQTGFCIPGPNPGKALTNPALYLTLLCLCPRT